MFAWILIGLISGWLAGKILNGNGYGMCVTSDSACSAD